MKIDIRIEIFKEGDVYVALSPDLNVSSFSKTIKEAKKSINEAIKAFIEECRKMGTLEDVLEESGFSNSNDSWESREPIEVEILPFTI